MTLPVDFVFLDPAATDANLVFAPDGVGGTTNATISGAFPPLAASLQIAGPVDATITGSFAGLAAQVDVVQFVQATVAGSFAGLTVTASAEYDSATDRPITSQRSNAWQDAEKVQDGAAQPQQDARAAPVGWAAFWQKTVGAPVNVEHPLPDVFESSPVSRAAGHQDATGIRVDHTAAHQDATRAKVALLGVFQNASIMRDGTAFPHQDGDRTKRARLASEFENAKGLRAQRWSDFQGATPLSKAWHTEHQEGVPPPAGITLLPTTPEPPAGCYTPDPDLVYSWPFGHNGTNLVFICGDYVAPPTITVPVRKVYIVINTATLRRVSDNATVPTFGLSLSLDFGSWTWGWQASIPGSARALVQSGNGTPVELAATINGTEYRLVAERIARDRVFGDSRVTVQGRGKNAALDAPYSPIKTFENTQNRTAQQLMEDALTVNGVPIGWSIDWGLTDWLVPAGAWSHRGTYISALSKIAQAAGGYLQPHRTANTLKVRHLYPTAPWNWGGVVPDFVLPADVVSRESMQWVDKAAYNRVFVSGQQVGVLGRVTRQGTAGDLLAPMTVDPLITHADAARQRGIAILGDTGKQLSVGLRLPVLAETGIIEPGAFVQYDDGGTDHVGIVRATSVEVGLPEVWQTLEVETHA